MKSAAAAPPETVAGIVVAPTWAGTVLVTVKVTVPAFTEEPVAATVAVRCRVWSCSEYVAACTPVVVVVARWSTCRVAVLVLTMKLAVPL